MAYYFAKLHAYGMSYQSCELIRSYLTERKQRVKMESTRSDWLVLKRGVPQGSILSPLLFNFFANDMFFVISNSCRIYNYADDNSISYHHKNLNVIKVTLEQALDEALNWFKGNYLQANPCKFQAIYFSRNKETQLVLSAGDTEIVSETTVKMLGVQIDNDMSFRTHVSSICKKASGQMKALSRMSNMLSIQSKTDIYNAFIMSNFMYCMLVWHLCGTANSMKIEKIQERCIRFIYLDYKSTYNELLGKSGKVSFYVLRLRNLGNFVFDVLQKTVPAFLHDLFELHVTNFNLRDNKKITLKQFATMKFGFNSLQYHGAKIYNQLPPQIKLCTMAKDFKNALRKWDGPKCQCGYCILCQSRRGKM